MGSNGNVESLEKQLSADPYNEELYLSLIDACIEDAPEKVEEVRHMYRSNLIPTVEFWLNWMTETVLAIQNGSNTVKDVCQICPFHIIKIIY